MKIEVKITAREGFGDEKVDVTVGEEIVGGTFKTEEGTGVLRVGLRRLVDEAEARAEKQIEARRMLADSEAVTS